jgi:hypothetical protein
MAKLMGKMLKWFQITCRDTTPLISEVMDHSLPFGKSLRLKIHLAICGVCCFYKRQLETIHALAQKLGREDAPTQEAVALSEQAKTKIRDSLRQSS